MQAGNHPDFRFVGLDGEGLDELGEAGTDPEEEATSSLREQNAAPSPSRGKAVRARPEIRIDAIRSLGDFALTGARRSGQKVVLISAADRLNAAAANALLKTLEEPMAGLVFILASEAPARILPTVRSRCVILALTAPSNEVARDWILSTTGLEPNLGQRLLDAGGGAPLTAKAYGDPIRYETYQIAHSAIASLPNADLLEVAQRLEALEPSLWVIALQRWVEDLARVAGGIPPRSKGTDLSQLNTIAAQSSLQALVNCAQQLLRFRRSVDHPLNPRLYAEATLRVYTQAFTAAKD
jgi:DNA polymerase-3 subunit delta'